MKQIFIFPLDKRGWGLPAEALPAGRQVFKQFFNLLISKYFIKNSTTHQAVRPQA